MQQIQTKVLRSKQVSQFLGIGLSTFWRWVQKGKYLRGIHLSVTLSKGRFTMKRRIRGKIGTFRVTIKQTFLKNKRLK